MTKTLMIVAEMAVINWALLLLASLLRSKAWKPSGLLAAMGNRDNMADPEGLAARTDRASRNMLENLVLFSALRARRQHRGHQRPARRTRRAHLLLGARGPTSRST